MTVRRVVAGLWVVMMLVSACSKAEPDPTPSPDSDSIHAASTLFAQPTRAPRLTPTPTPVNEVELDLNRTTARMERAVLAGDVDEYLANIWEGDPLFLEEHRRWALDWQEHRLRVFEIDLYGIQLLSPDTAAARMTTLWSQRDRSDAGSAGGATTSVLFHRENETWLLAGERWKAVDLPQIRFYHFADEIVNNEPQAQIVLEYLPSIIARVNEALGFVPEHTVHIRMYDNAVTLQNWTRLSVPTIEHWNEPGEAIKLAVGASNTAPTEAQVAAEYARFVLYEMADGTHGAFPWWLEEGISQVGGGLFQTLSRRNRVIDQVAALASAPVDAEQHLFDWSSLDTPPDLLPEAHQLAVDQAFTFVHYVTETYGADRRNAWIGAIAANQTVDVAAQTHLGASFAELDADWRAWLAAQS